MDSSTPVLLTIGETQQRLRVGRSTVYRLVHAGDLDSVKVGRARRIVADSVLAFAARLLAEQR